MREFQTDLPATLDARHLLDAQYFLSPHEALEGLQVLCVHKHAPELCNECTPRACNSAALCWVFDRQQGTGFSELCRQEALGPPPRAANECHVLQSMQKAWNKLREHAPGLTPREEHLICSPKDELELAGHRPGREGRHASPGENSAL
jgi:hypothetical protein